MCPPQADSAGSLCREKGSSTSPLGQVLLPSSGLPLLPNPTATSEKSLPAEVRLETKKETNVGSKDRESPPAPRHLQCPATGLGLVGSPWGGADEPSYNRGRGGIKANHSLSAWGLRLQSSRFTVPGRKPDLASDCCNHRKMGLRFICLFCT